MVTEDFKTRYVELAKKKQTFSLTYITGKDYHEVGVSLGQSCKDNGFEIEECVGERRFLDEQIAVYGEHYPRLLEEISGIAEGWGKDPEQVLLYHITEGLYWHLQSQPSVNCTILGVRDKDGQAIIGRNLDWIPALEGRQRIYTVSNGECNDVMRITDMNVNKASDFYHKFLYPNCIDAINDKGLYIGITFGHYATFQPGLNWSDMSKLIAETCSTVDEALGIFEKTPLATPKNFFIADKDGDMAVVEHMATAYHVRRPKDGVLIQTNHAIHPDAVRYDPIHKTRLSNTFKRYDAAAVYAEQILSRMAQAGSISPEDMRLPTAIGDAASTDPTDCATDHMKGVMGPRADLYQFGPDFRTIWTLVLDMRSRDYEMITGMTGIPQKTILRI